jgi:hypothetical protein
LKRRAFGPSLKDRMHSGFDFHFFVAHHSNTICPIQARQEAKERTA